MDKCTSCKIYKAVAVDECTSHMLADIYGKTQRIHYNVIEAAKHLLVSYIKRRYDGFALFTHDQQSLWISLRGAYPQEGEMILEDLKTLKFMMLTADGYYIAKDATNKKLPSGYQINENGDVFLDYTIPTTRIAATSFMEYFAGIAITITYLDNYQVVYRFI